MARYHLSTTHLWSEEQVTIDRRTFFHRQCQVCGRDFARSLDDGEWRAVYVGGLRCDFLNDETTRRWVSEDCPGKRLPGEGNGDRIQPGGEQASSKHRPGA
jgi:uncharacterized cysteine cluster protein YcgN (CxxCxxCC family)